MLGVITDVRRIDAEGRMAADGVGAVLGKTRTGAARVNVSEEWRDNRIGRRPGQGERREFR